MQLYITDRHVFCQELPGRLWDGKEGMLAALAALCKAAPQALMSSSQSSAGSRAVVDALMAALARKKQTYRCALSMLITQSCILSCGKISHDLMCCVQLAVTPGTLQPIKVL